MSERIHEQAWEKEAEWPNWRKNERADERAGTRENEPTNQRTNERTNEWVDEQTNERAKERTKQLNNHPSIHRTNQWNKKYQIGLFLIFWNDKQLIKLFTFEIEELNDNDDVLEDYFFIFLSSCQLLRLPKCLLLF